MRSTEYKRPESTWAIVAAKSRAVLEMSEITMTLYTGSGSNLVSEDEIKLLSDLSSIRQLYKENSDRITNQMAKEMGVTQPDDFGFLRERLVEVVNQITCSSWKASGQDYERARALSDASIYLIEGTYSDSDIKKLGTGYQAVPGFENIAPSTTIAGPSMDTILEINAIKDESVKKAILGDMDIKGLMDSVISDIKKYAKVQVEHIMREAKVSPGAITDKESSILHAIHLKGAQRFYGATLAKELQEMRTSNQYSNIHEQVSSVVSFFQPFFTLLDKSSGAVENVQVVEEVKVEQVEQAKPIESIEKIKPEGDQRPLTLTEKMAARKESARLAAEASGVESKPVVEALKTPKPEVKPVVEVLKASEPEVKPVVEVLKASEPVSAEGVGANKVAEASSGEQKPLTLTEKLKIRKEEKARLAAEELNENAVSGPSN